mmetsp:Transcript_6431/g.18231  ORF Transcript_6431/g.18231 Transcript_6431/m.18231 type:complete len:248 (+) Transcript_6431:1085-1828(+)
MAAMQMRPESSWSATLRKRLRGLEMPDRKTPPFSSWEKASRSAPRGTRTWSNHSLPLSTPLHPILCPMSSTLTPSQTLRSSFRILTMTPWIPWSFPATSSLAKTTAQCACTAPLVIQYFWASVEGVCTTSSSVSGSYVAVVCISTALLPKPSSVRAKQPTCSKRSMRRRKSPWWRSVPSFITVPPNRLNCTVIFVAIDPSHIPATSCAAKMRYGLSPTKSLTLQRSREHRRRRRWYASSRSRARGRS